MIDRTNADQYFNDHAQTAEWFGFSEGSREGAIASARRTLSRSLGRALRDDEPAYKEGDARRDEYAAYEQALHALQRSRVADPNASTPYPVAMPAQATVDVTGARVLLAPEALRWLGVINTVRVVKG